MTIAGALVMPIRTMAIMSRPGQKDINNPKMEDERAGPYTPQKHRPSKAFRETMTAGKAKMLLPLLPCGRQTMARYI